jgi:hypothetical protein
MCVCVCVCVCVCGVVSDRRQDVAEEYVSPTHVNICLFFVIKNKKGIFSR